MSTKPGGPAWAARPRRRAPSGASTRRRSLSIASCQASRPRRAVSCWARPAAWPWLTAMPCTKSWPVPDPTSPWRTAGPIPSGSLTRPRTNGRRCVQRSELYTVERLVPRPFPGDADAQAERQRLRQEQSRPILDRIWTWATVQVGLPRSEFGKAVRYMVERWSGLTRFVDDPRIPLDNNAVERTLRGPVVGRKNHYGSKFAARHAGRGALLYPLRDRHARGRRPPGLYAARGRRRARRTRHDHLPRSPRGCARRLNLAVTHRPMPQRTGHGEETPSTRWRERPGSTSLTASMTTRKRSLSRPWAIGRFDAGESYEDGAH